THIALAPRHDHSPFSRSVYLLVRCALSSTLFPYTTLFRSTADNPRSRRMKLVALMLKFWVVCGNYVVRLTAVSFLAPYSRYSQRDRKSTRLNSSHGSISYAVFCLTNKSELRTA